MEINKDIFNRAVRRYIGYGINSFPGEDTARLIAEFGPELGGELGAQVKSLLEELDRIKPIIDSSPLESAKNAVAELNPITLNWNQTHWTHWNGFTVGGGSERGKIFTTT